MVQYVLQTTGRAKQMAHGLRHATALSPPVDKAVRSECINVENDLVLFNRDWFAI